MAYSLGELARPYATVSICGLCKNAGKTTALNALVAQADPQTLALTSIGRDGEAVDVVTGTKKPGIFVRCGTLFATAAGLLRDCDVTKEIVDTTDVRTPLGDVVLVRARSDGRVQLAGPSVTDQLAGLNRLFFSHGAGRVFIDGAAGRKSLCSRAVSDAAILCSGASLDRSIDRVLDETEHVYGLLTLDAPPDARIPPLIDTRRGGPLFITDGYEVLSPGGYEDLPDFVRQLRERRITHVFASGALTDARLGQLVDGPGLRDVTVVAQDAAKLLVSRAACQRLRRRGGKLAVMDTIRLIAITVNPYSVYGRSFDKNEFEDRLASRVGVPVINVLEDEHA